MTNFLQTKVLSVAFPDRLIATRKARGLTQEGLGDLASLTKLQIHRYERGTSQPTLDALKRMAVALNVSIDELVFEEQERKPEGELLLLFEGVSRLDCNFPTYRRPNTPISFCFPSHPIQYL
jgi:transcriptional regulator with XRE-family HTH domain